LVVAEKATNGRQIAGIDDDERVDRVVLCGFDLVAELLL
jgi:hypothetical protein